MIYTLYACLEGTRGQDNEVTLTLSVDRPAPPYYLADFVGGSGAVSDGYSDTKQMFQIDACKHDAQRLELSFEDGRRHVLNPAFQQTYTGEVVRPLVVLPLASAQRLNLNRSDFDDSKYVVTHASWWEPIGTRRR
ncbi:hypothetical protein [Paraburkholderia sp. GAS32]|uniref:hypothetical protein n=1 Tax=Paraburkholderia sp. GAS32 TaxID=3035129 RepID=UPI003D1B3466